MARTAHPPIHPGEILREEFLEPMELSQYRLAKDISVPARRINEIVHGKRGITADTALRLARYFGTTERFWMNLQTHYDLEVERRRLHRRLTKEVAVEPVDVIVLGRSDFDLLAGTWKHLNESLAEVARARSAPTEATD